MGQQTTVWAALATSQQIQYAIPYIDPNSLQPTLDGGALAGVPTGGGLAYVPNLANAPISGLGGLFVGYAGDITGTDAINAGAQLDSYIPVANQNAALLGGVPGHTVSTSFGTRYIPAIITAANVTIGEFAGYGYVNSGGINQYKKLTGIRVVTDGVNAAFPGGAMFFGTTIDGGASYSELMKLLNDGSLQLAGKFSLPVLGGAFQSVTYSWACTGVPNNAFGANGDFVFRSDGGAGTCIYQKRGGVWVATGA